MSSDYERQYYEEEDFWDWGAATNFQELRRYDETAGLVPEGVRTLLDVGCGNGAFGARVEALRPEIDVTGVDRSELALRHVTTAKLYGDVSDLPVEDRSFDVVTCLEVLEHLTVESFEAAILELTRVSKRFVIVGVPFEERLERNTTRCPRCRAVFNVDLHLQAFSAKRMRELLVATGFAHLADIFPGQSRRPVGIAFAQRARRRVGAWRSRHVFGSPVCPLCGFRSDKRPSTSVAAGNAIDRVPSVLRRMWPRYEDRGYWIASLFERMTFDGDGEASA